MKTRSCYDNTERYITEWGLNEQKEHFIHYVKFQSSLNDLDLRDVTRTINLDYL